MGNFSFYRVSQNLKIILYEHLSLNKKWYILLLGVAILAIIVGIVLGVKIAPDSSIDKIPDSVLISYAKKDCSIFSLLISRLIGYLGLILIFWCAGFRRALSIFTFLAIAYKSFYIGLNGVFFIVLFGVSGIVNALVVFLPACILGLVGLICWASVCIGYSFDSCVYGGSVFSRDFLCKSRWLLYTSLVCILCACLYEAIILPWTINLIILS